MTNWEFVQRLVLNTHLVMFLQRWSWKGYICLHSSLNRNAVENRAPIIFSTHHYIPMFHVSTSKTNIMEMSTWEGNLSCVTNCPVWSTAHTWLMQPCQNAGLCWVVGGTCRGQPRDKPSGCSRGSSWHKSVCIHAAGLSLGREIGYQLCQWWSILPSPSFALLPQLPTSLADLPSLVIGGRSDDAGVRAQAFLPVFPAVH